MRQGLARLDTLNLLDDETVRAEIRAAAETTFHRRVLNGNQSLCHGDLGNLEFLYRVQVLWPEKRWQARYTPATTAVLERMSRSGWRSGTPHHVETPGLMLGLAGMALQLLRLAEPSRVPSILTMDPPIPSRRPSRTPTWDLLPKRR